VAVSLASRFMDLFSGMKEAYGCYVIDESNTTSVKKKGRAWTRRGTVKEHLWDKHLKGIDMLGIIPINRDNLCQWGAIDIDVYDLKLEVFAKRIAEMKLPMIPMRSKSGGCHLVMFLSEKVPARDLQKKLSEIAASMGYGDCEIFPKQSSVLVEKGDLGNWLNMPYFGGEKSTRYALDKDGQAVSPSIFLSLASAVQMTAKQMSEVVVKTKTDALSDGPPCLQALISQGFPAGTRNNGLFALGVYCRKAFQDNWKDVLEQYNAKHMDPPLATSEVASVIKQLEKKDYHYKCRDQPICNFCNAALCRTRPFGIGAGSMPTLTSLSKIPTDQPVWFLDINGVRIELTTEQLQIQTRFQKLCMDTLNVMPPRQSDRQWQNIVQDLLNKCKVLEKPKEAGIGDQFIDLVNVFCSDSRLLATSREELVLGRAWVGEHPEKVEATCVYFRLKDLEDFLIRNNFRHFNRSQMISRIQSILKGNTHFFNIRGRGVNVWYIPEPDQQTESFDLPEMKGDIL